MSARRTGTIVMKPSGAFARVWVKLPDGTEERRWMNLQTKDRTTAKRKLARLVAALASGELVAEAQAKATAGDTYKTYTLDRNEKRKAPRASSWRATSRATASGYIYPLIGDMPLGQRDRRPRAPGARRGTRSWAWPGRRCGRSGRACRATSSGPRSRS